MSTTTCTTCGADLEHDATVCAVCGEEVAAPDLGSPEPGAASGSTPGGQAPPMGDPHAATAGTTPPPPAGGYGTGGYANGGYGAPTYTPQPHPSGLPADVRNWGMAAHLSAFAGFFVAGLSFVGPLIVWLIKREEHPFIEHHAKEALNFNLSVLLYGVVSAVLLLVFIGLITGLATLIAWAIFTIIAGVKASNGEGYRYPLTIRFIS